MDINEKLLIEELQRMAAECRLQSRSARPQLALLRLASSLQSLAVSLKSAPSDNSPLTVREREILVHVSNGFTNRDIASALSISEKTIEFHLKSIFRKTEASSRTEAVKQALSLKWI